MNPVSPNPFMNLVAPPPSNEPYDKEKAIAESRERLRNRPLPDIRELPIPVTRDFLDFPFKQLELNFEDKQSFHRSQCFKFQTTYYIAYVHHFYQDYIQPEHLENPNDSPGMREARRNAWGNLSGKENYDMREKYPYECSVIDYEKIKLDDQHTKDNINIYGEEIVDELEKIDKKYTFNNYLWIQIKNSIGQNWKSCVAVARYNPHKTKIITAVALSAIAATVFFYSQVPKGYFSWHQSQSSQSLE